MWWARHSSRGDGERSQRPTFTVLGRQRLVSGAEYYATAGGGNRGFDVAPDGRFLMLRAGASTSAGPAPVVLVENFLVELEAKVAR